MKKLHKYLMITVLIGLVVFPLNNLIAGNEDRTGEAGASELLINPWARSSGWGDANSACIRGLEAQYLNVAGTAFTKGTELVFSRTIWLQGTDININAFGISQKLGENKGVISFGIMSMSFGEIDITTVDFPEGGGIGTFSPSLLNISISYAKAFSNSIYGGINFKIISEQISDVSAQGLAIDAGIQYVTGVDENIKFGISMKNVGPTMKYSGDGLSFRGFVPGQENSLTVEQRSASFELPSLIKIGASYDFLFTDHTLTVAGNFTSNSFTKDQYALGLQYSWKEYLVLRGGYVYEEDLFSDFDAGRTTALTGPTAGITVQAPLNKEKGSSFSVNYSYRASDPFSGTHSIGARINL